MKKLYFLGWSLLLSGLSFGQITTETFTANGAFNVPAGITSINVEVIGAGGNGASNGGGGGGGGGYAAGVYSVTPGAVLSVMVANGGSGGNTGVPSLGITASAGSNATTVPNPNLGGGGAGGSGVGGNIVNRTGGTGGGGYWTYFGGGGAGAAGDTANGQNGFNTIVYSGGNCLTPGGAGGYGGGGMAGSGGKGAGFVDNNCTQSNPSADGQNYGAGGGGGNGIGSAVGQGSGGYVSISYGTVSIGENKEEKPLYVVGNPFVSFIGIKNATGKEEFFLYSTAGQLLWSGKQIAQHDFSYLPKGCYFLQVTDAKNNSVLKLMKD